MDLPHTTDKHTYYSTLSKFKLVEMLKERGEAKYAFARTKPEIIRKLCELDTMPKPKVCKCCDSHSV